MRLENHINHVYKYDKAVEDTENKKSEKINNEYQCKYRHEGKGEWVLVTVNFDANILTIVVLAKNDDEDSTFYKGHIISAIESALKRGRTENIVMWY